MPPSQCTRLRNPGPMLAQPRFQAPPRGGANGESERECLILLIVTNRRLRKMAAPLDPQVSVPESQTSSVGQCGVVLVH